MGTTTANIGLYIPSAGESGYDDAFAQGMINLDQHDHTGGPNKGLPITSSGLGPASVTFDKLNPNVADNSTGIGTDNTVGNQNRLIMLGILKNLYTLAVAAGKGFVTMNGQPVAVRTFQDTATATWANADGSGNPSVDFNIAGISPVGVANGGTGVTSLSPWDVIVGGTNSTNPVQQVSGEGTLNQYLGSNGALAIPSWKTLPTIPPQTVFQATVTLTAAQFKVLSGTPFEVVAAQGAGTVIVPITAIGKVNVVGAPFGSGSAVLFGYGSTAQATDRTNLSFVSGSFNSAGSGYYFASADDPTGSVIGNIAIENQGLFITVNSSNFNGGGTSTVDITTFYSVI